MSASPSDASAHTSTVEQDSEELKKMFAAAAAKGVLFLEGANNPRNIPNAVFLEDVPLYVSTHYGNNSEDAEALLKKIHELYGKYKFMENKLVQQKRGLLQKIPDIKNALEALHFLKKKEDEKEITTQFELSDQVYVKAAIKKPESVMLWLGANVMVEYPYDEAVSILTTNLQNAHMNLGTVSKHLAFLKDQITISEVNIARVHNHKVFLRQQEKAASGGSS